MKLVLLIVGVLVAISGLFWAAQGMGWINWPVPKPGEFTMVNDRMWVWYGLGTAFVGLLLVAYSRRR